MRRCDLHGEGQPFGTLAVARHHLVGQVVCGVGGQGQGVLVERLEQRPESREQRAVYSVQKAESGEQSREQRAEINSTCSFHLVMGAMPAGKFNTFQVM